MSRVTNCVTVPNFIEISQTVAEICKFQYYASLALKCLFTPPFYEVLGAHFPQMMSLIDRPGPEAPETVRGKGGRLTPEGHKGWSTVWGAIRGTKL